MKALLQELGEPFEDLGNTIEDPSDDYPDYAFKVGEAVARNPKAFGILTCGSAQGVCIAANKVPGVRAVYVTTHAEAAKTRSLIVNELSFDRDVYVKNFEVTIRLLGGLLSSYQLTGDKRLLNLAEDLGTRLLPVFNSPTGLPYVYVNLRSGEVRDAVTNPAETGTLLLEFGTLSKLTGKPIFYEKAKRALLETYKSRSAIGS